MHSLGLQILSRERITAGLLRSVASRRFTVLAAPMGYGKTTAARDLMAALPGQGLKRAYYVSIPAEDHPPHYLWNQVWGRLAAQGLEFAETAQRYGFHEDAVSLDHFRQQCRAISEPALLIIDDYQFLSDKGLNEYFASLACQDVGGLRLLALSRAKPDLPLEEWRLKGLALVFDQNFLAFSESETRDFFKLHGHDDPLAAREAWRFSEGWPAALWLALSNWRAGGPIAQAAGLEPLLDQAVFSTYGPEDQKLLLSLSPLDSFTLKEAAEVFGHPSAGERLKKLHHHNGFISFDPVEGRYVLHSIFRAFLSKLLPARADFDFSALSRQVAECYFRRGDLIQAAGFFHQAGRDEDLLRLLDLFLAPGGNFLLLLSAGEIIPKVLAVPWELRFQRPVEYLAFIYYYLTDVSLHEALPLLEEAEDRFLASSSLPPALKKRVAGEIVLMKSLLAFNDFYAMRDIYVEAHKLLDGHSAISARHLIWNFDCPHTAYLYLREPGSYRPLVELVASDLRYYQELSDGCSLGGDFLVRAEYELETGNLEGVEQLLNASVASGESKQQLSTVISAEFTRARLYIAAGRAGEAAAVLSALRPKVEASGHRDHAVTLDLALGYIFTVLGDYESLPPWLKTDELIPAHDTPNTNGFIKITRGRALMLTGDYAAAEVLAKALPAWFGPFDNLFGFIHAGVLEAAAAARLYGWGQARPLLEKALALAAPDQVIQTIAEYGEFILPLLRRLEKEGPADSRRQALLARTEQVARGLRALKKPARQTFGGLTRREADIMRLVVKGHGNADIARRLGIAPATVTKILSSAYSRLKVKNRAEAVYKFLELAD